MADKIFNVRIKNRYDTYNNWYTQNPVLQAGELALCVVGSADPGSTVKPTVLAKCGDGSSHYNDLSFLSATASDVYSWAKAENKPTYAASEITGLEEKINATVKDTDTQYRLTTGDNLTYKLQSSKTPTVEDSWTDVGSFKVTTVAAGTADGTIKVDGVDMAITGFSALSNKVTANETAIATLNGNAETDGSVAHTAKALDDTLKSELETEINSKISSTYKPGGTIEASALTTDLLVAANEGKVYNLSSVLTTDNNFVDPAEKTYPIGTNVVVINTGTTEAPAYKFDVLAGFVDLSSYATHTEVTDGITNALRDPTNMPSNIPASKIKDLDTTAVGAVNTELTKETSTTKTNVKNIADASATAKIADLDVADTAVAGQVVTAVSETNGKISVTRAAVDIANLAQDTGDTIIFDCGGAGAATT